MLLVTNLQLPQQIQLKKQSGILGKGVVGQKLVELQGGANHYYVKRISEIVDTEGSTVTKFYALDPSQVNNFATS